MTKPAANLSAALNKKRAEEPKAGGVAATFRTGKDGQPTKKATYLLPADLHRALHLHAVHSDVSMRDLVVRYIQDGLDKDGAA